MNDFEQGIIKFIENNPGKKTIEIAQALNCDRREVNSALYGNLRDLCYQDSSFRWYLNSHAKKVATADKKKTVDKCLSAVCKYYLNCLSLGESNGISAYLTSDFSLNYVELSSVKVDSSNENTAKLIRKVSSEKNLMAYVGYPVLIEKFYSTRTNQDYWKIAPVMLFPVEISGGAVDISPIPHINIEVIKQYSSRDVNHQVHDLIELENELGLNVPNADIELEDLAARLQAIREWQWRETLDPTNISQIPPISTIKQEGVYNRAIFIVAEKSPYTLGLESELSQLAELDEESYRGTALYDWIHCKAPASSRSLGDDSPLLEVLPMNSEQEQAVRYAENNKLTIVTGPPGTGKSQVVTNILANAAWKSKRVLFTSKNNKAVDVVETRLNALGQRPIMLRVGGNQYAHHLSELISNMLSSTADPADQLEYERYRALYSDKITAYKRLKEEKSKAIDIRNHTDHLEQKACELRDEWGEWFNKVSFVDVKKYRLALGQYRRAYSDWYGSMHTLFGKIFWFAVGKKKKKLLDERLNELNKYFNKYNCPIIAQSSESINENTHKKIYDLGQQSLEALQTIIEYCEASKELLAAPQLERIDRELIKIKSDLADIAGQLWNKWLITRPLQVNAECRREMNEYISAMNLIGNADLSMYPDIQRRFKQLQQKMSEFLPCWAVTALSARGRVPFEPGAFDLVVIDEASQCDIASVLPMLYRAKRAVIIGDPRQLSHISTISKAQDLALIQKYNVDMGWAYSANSLYAKASSLSVPSHIIQLRDHHRSFGDIIEFSNAEFYDGKLRVATNYDKLKCPSNIDAGIRWIDTIGETVCPSNGSAFNDAEIRTIVEELQRLVSNRYEGSIGVVTPFRAQADRIEQVISKNEELRVALAQNDFLVDTVHKFQGDERDVMFFSPVIAQGVGQNALNFLKNTGNLFNVAITRARAVLIVAGDFNYCSRCGVAYMEHFIDHIRRIKAPKEADRNSLITYPCDREYPNVSNPEQVSDWEKLFYTALFDNGIKTLPQYPVDKYKLDLAILDGERKLDIEVDGEMYHKDWNGELSYRDQLRNQRLFELGWDVKRFWVYQIRDNLQECIEEVRRWRDK